MNSNFDFIEAPIPIVSDNVPQQVQSEPELKSAPVAAASSIEPTPAPVSSESSSSEKKADSEADSSSESSEESKESKETDDKKSA